MRSDLAERLLKALMDWDVPRFGQEVPRVQMLATLKYDEYGGYRPGVKFAENLARWLEQFEIAERQTAYDFVMQRLVFISDVEMEHLLEVAYPDHLEPRLLRRAATDLSQPAHRVRTIAADPHSRALTRRSLFLGLSDGARLDQLRRASQLSHEQFVQDYLIADEQADGAQAELANALKAQDLPGDATFRQIFLVDDFSGSGRTLLRPDDDAPGAFKGKLVKFNERLDHLTEKGIVADDVAVGVLLYVASHQAVAHLVATKPTAGFADWTIDVVQELGTDLRVDLTSPEMTQLCRDYYDPSTIDVHKDETSIGYDDCALPVVLSHNTPNNSVCLLWAETPDDLDRKALFPRYERHHKDRP